MKTDEPMKILIVFLSGIGNLLLMTPTLRAIRNKYPDAEITLCVKQKVVAEIVRKSGLVDNIIQYSGSSFSADGISFVFGQRTYKYDLVVTTFDAKGWKLALFIKMIAAKYSIGYKAGKWYDMFYDCLLTDVPGIHEVDKHLLIADSLNIGYTKKDLGMHLTEEDRSFAASIVQGRKGPMVGIHPGSSEYLLSKRWMPERFAKLADKINNNFGAQIFIMGGPAEVRLAEKVAGLMSSPEPVILAGETSISQAAAVIERCDLFISNDSGLMHVAAAVNTPTVAIFGPTDPKKNAPFGKEHIVVRKDLPCSPCLNYLPGGCDDLKCLKEISVEDVMDAIANKLFNLGVLENERKRAL